MDLMTFIINKEQADIILALKLQKEGKIITFRALFEVLIK